MFQVLIGLLTIQSPAKKVELKRAPGLSCYTCQFYKKDSNTVNIITQNVTFEIHNMQITSSSLNKWKDEFAKQAQYRFQLLFFDGKESAGLTWFHVHADEGFTAFVLESETLPDDMTV